MESQIHQRHRDQEFGKVSVRMATYWHSIESVWNEINIYDGPDIFLETYGKVPVKIGLLYAAHFCQSEVCNGGFGQFFFNSTGVLAPEAVRGFRAIGQNQIAGLIENAMSSFGSMYPRDREDRQSLLDGLGSKTFDGLDDQFFALIESEAGGFILAADAFAAGIYLN
jgi:hypothetical protein